MNERSEPISRVALNSLPDVEHRSTRRVNQHASDLTKDFEVPDRHTERRQDHYILGLHPTEIDVPASRFPLRASPFPRHEERDTHRPEFRVHVRVMDDLTGQINGTIRELLSGLVGVVDCPFDPITEPKLLGQTDGYIPGRKCVFPGLEQIDKVARIVGCQFGLDLGFQPETFPKVGGSPGSVWRAGLHIPSTGGGGPVRARRLHRRIRHILNLAVAN